MSNKRAEMLSLLIMEDKVSIQIKIIRKGNTGYRKIYLKRNILKGKIYGKERIFSKNDKR